MKRFVTFALAALAMLVVALISAFIAMRLAIHGREAVVPPLTGLTVAEAEAAAGREGLHLALENRFYSADLGAGRILAQDPPAGSRVRRDWPVRIIESLGTQRVNAPDLAGKSEREAAITIRRLGLEPGVVARLPIEADADVVLAQTPTPNSGGADSPRVSLLVSDTENAPQPAYVMPSLVGLSYAAATARAATAGLHLVAEAEAPAQPVPAAPPVTNGTSVATPAQTVTPPTPQPEVPPNSGIVLAQTPAPGGRVQKGDAVHVTLGHPGAPDAQ